MVLSETSKIGNPGRIISSGNSEIGKSSFLDRRPFAGIILCLKPVGAETGKGQ